MYRYNELKAENISSYDEVQKPISKKDASALGRYFGIINFNYFIYVYRVFFFALRNEMT